MGFFSRPASIPEGIREELENQAARIRNLLGEIEALEVDLNRRFREIDDRVGEGEKKLRLMAEEIDERIDRGNKVWRKIRAAQEYAERDQDSDEEPDTSPQLQLIDGDGGTGEGVYPVHPGVDNGWESLPAHARVAKQIAARIAGR